MSHFHDVPWDISFSGSGFLATYQLGVVLCFLQYSPWILQSAPFILGASAGSVVAAAAVCKVDPITIRDEMILFAKKALASPLGPLNPSNGVSKWLESVLRKHLPSDAHHFASGRLGVAVTRLSDGMQLILSEYQSKEDVVDALMCSCFVPGYCGFLPPEFKGVHYMDGGFSGLQPLLSEASSRTLTVCPYSGEADICPTDPPSVMEVVATGAILNCNMANGFRILNSLYPLTLETVEQAFHVGFKDAIQFLQSNDVALGVKGHSIAQRSLNHNPANSKMDLNTPKVEEQEMKEAEQTDLKTSLEESRSMQMFNSTMQEPIEDPLPHFDIMKNVLMGNVTTYLSMFGLPVRIFSNLLLPLVVSFYAMLQSRQRLKLLFKEVPQLVVWGWHFTRLTGFFFINILIYSLQRLIKDRLTRFFLLLQWLKLQTQYEVL
ncbi:patatin-like phospholipase domain-containing protein 2 isoform X1 [Cyprinodon tularosa]|uniref:patatin-like phospholipase domain-containing protein 2 isoform X1 n=1 Tax=Cyprinodon tularosa TaxID=77115 RepID=UPI0018E21F5C|nr:patatin-like phospholipase domain-containing protein 2 isoform X1 [Cyprinodon tularosa]